MSTASPDRTPDQTIDGYEVFEGMRVWDYDLEPGTLTLENPHESHGVLWYTVNRDKGGNSTMDSKRLWFRHPTDGKKA